MECKTEFVKEREGVKEFRLSSNGLRILLVPRSVGEAVALMVHYNIGSRNEGGGNTGSAHILEHLMFKGSTNFPRADDHIAKIFARTGAVINANTMVDRTGYHEIMTPEHLELCMRIEADRMRNATFTDQDRQDEMTVVRNEFEIGENKPLMVLMQRVTSVAILEHPYHHPTIGWRSDVEGVGTESFREFYDTFYHPNNALIILIGDLPQEKTLEMVASNFGHIAASTDPIPEVHTIEPPQQGERRVTIKRPGGNGLVHFAWMVPGASHPDFAPLEVLQYVLTEGKRSLLKKEFVDSGRVAEVAIDHAPFKDPYPFHLSIDLLRQRGHLGIEKDMRRYLKRLKEDGLNKQQIDRAKRLIEAESRYERDSLNGMLMGFSIFEGAGSWEMYFTLYDDIRKVEVEDVMRVFREYIHPDNMTVGWYVPTRRIEEEA